jgi:hypothetical protein
MRIILGGLIFRHIKGNNFLAKDDKYGTNGVSLKKVVMPMTKAFLRQILDVEGIKHTKYETKNSMIAKIRAIQGDPMGSDYIKNTRPTDKN